MADKVLKTRIKLLYKTWDEWQAIKDTFIPFKGELCVVNVPAEAGAVTQEPALLAKVGDGVKPFGELPFMSALSANSHDWSLKENLEWADLSDDFKAALASYVGAGNEYRINKSGEVYTLQTREYDATSGAWGEWQDVAGSSIDISNKTDEKLVGTNGTALIWNESDGGGAKFENKDGTWSFVGVNDGGKTGVTGQLYTVDKNDGNKGTRLNMTLNGFYYTNGKINATYEAKDEIATKGDVENAVAGLGSALHYIGMTEKAEEETLDEALARIIADYQTTHAGYTLIAGAVAIVDTAEYIYDGSKWDEFGDEGLYETRADAEAAHNALTATIEAEEAARIAADEKIVSDVAAIYRPVRVEISDLPNGCSYVDYSEEVRVFVPSTTEFVTQKVGDGGDSNSYYMTVKTYGPTNAVKYIEYDMNKNVWETEYQDVKTDAFGRKFDYNWLAIAKKDGDTWINWATKSTKERMLGFNCGYKWYDENDKLIAIDFYRIKLADENCFDVTVDTVIDKKIASAINGKSFADIAHTGNVNDLIQDDGDYLVLDCNVDIT